MEGSFGFMALFLETLAVIALSNPQGHWEDSPPIAQLAEEEEEGRKKKGKCFLCREEEGDKITRPVWVHFCFPDDKYLHSYKPFKLSA